MSRSSIKLGEIGKVSMCKRVLKHQTSPDEEIPFYKISTFGGQPDTFISRELYSEYREKYSYPKPGDVLISAAGTVGKTVIFDGTDSYFQDSNIVWIDNDESVVSNRFLYYYYQTNPWMTTGGSTIKRIYNDNLRSLTINYPDSQNEQLKITNVLSNIDKKIELNNRINAELEQMAKTLYDYWFVQFDFPNEQGKPYKSSGGEMTFSKTLNRPIPSDWEVLKLEDVLEFEKGTEPGAKAYSDEQNSHTDTPFYRVGDINGETSTYVASSNHKLKIVEPKDIIVTFDGSVGRVGIGLNGAISGGLRHIYDKTGKLKESAIFPIFNNEYITKTIERYATGSVILHASSSIPYLNIPYSEKVFEEYQNITQPMYEKMIQNRQESQHLAHLRDWLLPMLMNGQVRIENE